MKISIITCTYNSDKFLQETINSVIDQNLNKDMYEHIFIDGFSSDSTINIINEYKKNYPENHIYLFQKQARWIYNAMNEWVRQARWEYITFLNSDDYYNNNVLNNYFNFIESNGNMDLYYWINNIVDSNGNITTEYPNRSIYKKWLNPYILAMACYIFQSNTFYKKSLHEKYWLYNENFKLVSDAEFFIKLAQAKVSNTFYNKIIVNFRIHDWSSSNNSSLQEVELKKVRILFFWKIVWNVMNSFIIFFKTLKKLHFNKWNEVSLISSNK